MRLRLKMIPQRRKAKRLRHLLLTNCQNCHKASRPRPPGRSNSSAPHAAAMSFSALESGVPPAGFGNSGAIGTSINLRGIGP